MIRVLLAAFAALFLWAGSVKAEETMSPEEKAEMARLIALRDSLKPMHGW
jgi:hypothetical protein